jgi:hypothetical protein
MYLKQANVPKTQKELKVINAKLEKAVESSTSYETNAPEVKETKIICNEWELTLSSKNALQCHIQFKHMNLTCKVC